MRYDVCVPIARRTPKGVSNAVDMALKVAQYAEIRLDHLGPGDIAAALEQNCKKMDRIICTVRPKSEGGAFQGSEEERIAALETAARYDPCLLDVEYQTLSGRKTLKKNLQNAKILASWHDFGGTPNHAELVKRFEKMSSIADHVKIVTTARAERDMDNIAGLYHDAERTRTKLIAFAMGELGRPTRFFCAMSKNTPFTYASLGRAVAPGQMSVRDMAKIKTSTRVEKDTTYLSACNCTMPYTKVRGELRMPPIKTIRKWRPFRYVMENKTDPRAKVATGYRLQVD